MHVQRHEFPRHKRIRAQSNQEYLVKAMVTRILKMLEKEDCRGLMQREKNWSGTVHIVFEHC